MEAIYLPAARAFLRYCDLPGAGPPIVWLHCLGGAAAAYARPAREPTLAGRRALLIDLLGFGCSDRPEGFDYSLAAHAGTVAATLDRLGLRGCTLVGHSMGGGVAIVLAEGRPDLVGALIVAETPLELREGSASRAFAAQTEAEFVAAGFAAFLAPLREAALAGDPTLASFVGQFALAAPHAVHRTAIGMVAATPTLRARLLTLPMPRAYLWGARTLEEEPESARLAAELGAQGLRTLIVPEAGHLMNLDNPAGFAAAVARALDDHDGVGDGFFPFAHSGGAQNDTGGGVGPPPMIVSF
jgi:pimeloyl-ACP methyl ester carboxylesterase